MSSPRSRLLYSLVLELRARREVVLAPTQGYHAYGLLLNILRARDPELSQQLHDTPGPKPLTVSPLRGPLKRHGAGVLVSPDQTYWLRLTILDEEMFARLLDAIIQSPLDRDLPLGSASFGLHRVVTAPGQSEWAACSSFDSLLEDGRPERRLRIAFYSPTAFRSGGQRNVALPLPGLVFGSLLARWNEFAPALLPETLREDAADGLLVAAYRLETRILDFGSYKEVGFEGECEFECRPELSTEAAAQLAALASFALFAGIGAKTTQGMGQARRVQTHGSSVPGGTGGKPTQAR